MNDKHTPGPWAIHGEPEPDGGATGIADSRGGYLAEVNTVANARLVAAAPDLLAALEVCAVELDLIERLINPKSRTAQGVAKALKEAKAAIAAAKGGKDERN